MANDKQDESCYRVLISHHFISCFRYFEGLFSTDKKFITDFINKTIAYHTIFPAKVTIDEINYL